MSQEAEPRYEVACLNDFLRVVPEDRIDACLTEFAEFLRMTHAAERLAGAPGSIELERFEWIDDGLTNLTIHLTPEVSGDRGVSE